MDCNTTAADRRRRFWVTQTDACGATSSCVGECGSPGFKFASPGVISTDNWIHGLIINMLMTDGRMADTPCGYTPGTQGGHWSESFMSNDDQIGSLLRKIPATGTISEGVNLIASHARATMERLISRGVAASVDVQARYIGNNAVALDVTVVGIGTFGNARVGLSVNKTPQGWVWGANN